MLRTPSGHLTRHSGVFTDAVIFRTPKRRNAALVAAGTLSVLLTACVGLDSGVSSPHTTAASASVTSPPEGESPAPGRTVEAMAPADLDSLRGVRIAIVVPGGGGDSTRVLRDALLGFAQQHGLVVDEFPAGVDAASLDAAFSDAVATQPHIVVGLGAGAVDVFAYTSSQFLDQDFLLIGAQVAEPTSNMTAVVWRGATSRGSGAPADGDLDDDTTTVQRGTDAAAAGLATVMSGMTGIVLHLPG